MARLLIMSLTALLLSGQGWAEGAIGLYSQVPLDYKITTRQGRVEAYYLLEEIAGKGIMAPDKQAMAQSRQVLARIDFARLILDADTNLDAMKQPGNELFFQTIGWTPEDEAILGLLRNEFIRELSTLDSKRYRIVTAPKAPKKAAKKAETPAVTVTPEMTASPTPTPTPKKVAEYKVHLEGARYTNQTVGRSYVDPVTLQPNTNSSDNVTNDGYWAEKLGVDLLWHYADDTDVHILGYGQNRSYDAEGTVPSGHVQQASVEKKDTYLLYGGDLPNLYRLMNGRILRPTYWTPYTLDLQNKPGVYVDYQLWNLELQLVGLEIRESKMTPQPAQYDLTGTLIKGNYDSFGGGTRLSLCPVEGTVLSGTWLRSQEDPNSLTDKQKTSLIVDLAGARQVINAIYDAANSADFYYHKWLSSVDPTNPASYQAQYYSTPETYVATGLPASFPPPPATPWTSTDYSAVYGGILSDAGYLNSEFQKSHTSDELIQLNGNLEELRQRTAAYVSTVQQFLGTTVRSYLEITLKNNFNYLDPNGVNNNPVINYGGNLGGGGGLDSWRVSDDTYFSTNASVLQAKAQTLSGMAGSAAASNSTILATQTDIYGADLKMNYPLASLRAEWAHSSCIPDLESSNLTPVQDSVMHGSFGTNFGPVVFNGKAFMVGPNFHNDLLVRPQPVPGNLLQSLPRPNFPYLVGTQGYRGDAYVDLLNAQSTTATARVDDSDNTETAEALKARVGLSKGQRVLSTTSLRLGATYDFRETNPSGYSRHNAEGNISGQLDTDINSFGVCYGLGQAEMINLAPTGLVLSGQTNISHRATLTDRFTPAKEFSATLSTQAQYWIDRDLGTVTKSDLKGKAGIDLARGGFSAKYQGNVDYLYQTLLDYQTETALGDRLLDYNAYWATVIGAGITRNINHNVRVAYSFNPVEDLHLSLEPFGALSTRDEQANSSVLASSNQVSEGANGRYNITDEWLMTAQVAGAQYRVKVMDVDINGNPQFTEAGDPLGTPTHNEFSVTCGIQYSPLWLDLLKGLSLRLENKYDSSILLGGDTATLEYNAITYGAAYSKNIAGADSTLTYSYTDYQCTGTDYLNSDGRTAETMSANMAWPIADTGKVGFRARTSNVSSKMLSRTFTEMLVTASWDFSGWR